MEELTRLSASALAQFIRDKVVSAEEAVNDYLRRIEEMNPQLNAFVHVDAEQALAQAREADLRIAHGEVR